MGIREYEIFKIRELFKYFPKSEEKLYRVQIIYFFFFLLETRIARCIEIDAKKL